MEIWDEPRKFYGYCLTRDYEDIPELPSDESAALQGIRAWRSEHRKKMIDSIERLIQQAEKNATSQYTRSAQRARWTRLAGQLIWYKDQILRAMTWEALEQDVNRMAKRVIQDQIRQKRNALTRPWTPTVFRKKDDQAPPEPDEASKETG